MAHILHPLSCYPLGNISHELQDGWKSFLNIHCYDPLDESALDDELLKILWKEGPFAQEATNLLGLVFWWERFGRYVPNFKFWH